MTLREVDCGDVIALENFFQELKTESLPPTWKYSHIGLVRRLEGLVCIILPICFWLMFKLKIPIVIVFRIKELKYTLQKLSLDYFNFISARENIMLSGATKIATTHRPLWLCFFPGNQLFSEYYIPLQYYIFSLQDKNPKTTTSTIDIEKLDRIFSKKDKDSEHMRDVCIREVQFDVLLNKLGEEDRSVIVKSAEVITRTIEQFCLV